jgi:class 3 adenylate cyclase
VKTLNDPNQLKRLANEHLLGMASVFLLDLSITGVFNIFAGRSSRIGIALLCELIILGGGGALASKALFWRLRRQWENAATITHDINSLPVLSALACWILSGLYCATAFRLGVYFPDEAAVESIPAPLRYLAGVWFSAIYAVLYGFYVHFLVADMVVRWRLRTNCSQQLEELGTSQQLTRQIATIFGFLPLLPASMIALDLSAFRPVRVAQGLTVETSLFLDLIAIIWVIAVSLFFVSRALRLPVAALMAAQRRLMEGDLSARVPILADNELGQLAASFNDMAKGLTERAKIGEAFERFVDPHVLASILNEHVTLPISRDATILFTDIAGFTSWAESLTPESTFQQLNDYFIELTSLIRFHGGTVNNFVGDGIVALFNLPTPQHNHAEAAINAALAIRARMAQRRQEGKFGPTTRIGINTGPVQAGVLGDEMRRTFAVYGDAVNIAARLEQLSKDFNTDILISGNTAKLLQASWPLRKVGEVKLRGRIGHVEVMTL